MSHFFDVKKQDQTYPSDDLVNMGRDDARGDQAIEEEKVKVNLCRTQKQTWDLRIETLSDELRAPKANRRSGRMDRRSDDQGRESQHDGENLSG